MRRAVAVFVFAIAALLLAAEIASVLVAATGWGGVANADLGRGGVAQVGAAFVAAGLGAAWAGWALWSATARTD